MNQQFRVKIKTKQDQMIQEDQILFPGYYIIKEELILQY